MRVQLAVLDDPRQGTRLQDAVVGLEALGQACLPGVAVDRAQIVKATELVERALGGGEEVSHEVLEAAREEIAGAGGALEDRAHVLGESVGVAVGLLGACDLLELVEEDDGLLAVGCGDPGGEGERVVEIALGVSRGQARAEGDLQLLAELGLGLQHGRGLKRVGDEAPRSAGLVSFAWHHSGQRRTVQSAVRLVRKLRTFKFAAGRQARSPSANTKQDRYDVLNVKSPPWLVPAAFVAEILKWYSVFAARPVASWTDTATGLEPEPGSAEHGTLDP
jgi:hypothetical protein